MTFTQVMRTGAILVLGMDAIYFAIAGADAIGWMILTVSMGSMLMILELIELMRMGSAKEKPRTHKHYTHARDTRAKLLGGDR